MWNKIVQKITTPLCMVCNILYAQFTVRTATLKLRTQKLINITKKNINTNTINLGFKLFFEFFRHATRV